MRQVLFAPRSQEALLFPTRERVRPYSLFHTTFQYQLYAASTRMTSKSIYMKFYKKLPHHGESVSTIGTLNRDQSSISNVPQKDPAGFCQRHHTTAALHALHEVMNAGVWMLFFIIIASFISMSDSTSFTIYSSTPHKRYEWERPGPWPPPPVGMPLSRI